MRVVVVGAGIFGVTGALELARRGHEVWLLDPGPLPHPDASSTDISKMVRLDYGADELYSAMMEEALEGWARLNASWPRPLFHETGFLLLSSAPLEPGGFEYESHRLLSARGHRLERMDRAALSERFAAWSERYVDGYYNPRGGWAESGEVVAALVRAARAAGVVVLEGARTRRVLERKLGVELEEGVEVLGDAVVVAAGAWTPLLLPELADRLQVVGQPVLHFRPVDAEPFRAPAFVPWAADIATRGWYGFCANAQGIVKIANHGPGIAMSASAERRVPPEWEERARAFLRDSVPALASAPLVATRLCLYCDSVDADPWVGRHPARAGVYVASGGSGHGFKFAPLWGEMVADSVEGRDNCWAARFAWRERTAAKFEAARHGEER